MPASRLSFPLNVSGLAAAVALHAIIVLTSEQTAPLYQLDGDFQNGVHALALILLLVLYGLTAKRLLNGATLRFTYLVLAVAVSAAPYLIAYAVQSSDLYIYVSYALVSQSTSPFLAGPAALGEHHPVVQHVWYVWRPYPAPYGPLWILLTEGVGKLCASIVANFLAFRLLGVAAFVGIIAVLRRYQPTLLTSLVILNPILIIEFIGDAHNDALFSFFLLLGIVWQQRPVRSGLAMALSAATKHVSIILAPLYIAAYARAKQWRRAALYTLVSGVVLVLAYAAVWAGWSTFDGIVSVNRNFFATPFFFAQWPMVIIYMHLVPDASLPTARFVAQLAGTALFAGALGWLTWRTWRGRLAVLDAGFWALAALFVLAFTWFQSWYLTWLLVFIPFLSPKLAVRALAGVTAAWLLTLYVTF